MNNSIIRITETMSNDMRAYAQNNYVGDNALTSTTNTTLLQTILDDAFLYCMNYKSSNRKASVESIVAEEKADKAQKIVRTTFRISAEMKNLFMEFYKTDNLSLAIRCAIRDVLTNNRRPDSLAPQEKLRFMIGQKNPEMLELYNAILNDIMSRRTINGYVEPFTGTGNIYLHNDFHLCENILNDTSKQGCNLFRVIQKYPVELKAEILSQPVSREFFEKCKTELNKLRLINKKNRIKAAAMYFFLCNCSVYGKGECFKASLKEDNYKKLVDVISVAHDLLRDAKITNTDALYQLDKLANASNQLIIYDPPYIGTEDYYRNQNTKSKVFKLHRELRNRIMRLKENNVCIITYRITASITMARKSISDYNNLHKSERKFRLRQAKRKVENWIKQELDALYLNRGFYISFKPLTRTKGQVEIIISSEYFNGSKPYTSPLCKKEVA